MDESGLGQHGRVQRSVVELITLATEVSTAVAENLGYEMKELTEGQFVAELCGLRMRRLMIAGVNLVQAGSEDSLGLPTRTIYEFWLVGTYALVGGGEALQRINSQALHTARLALGKELADGIELPPGARINIQDLATEVEELLAKTGIEKSSFPRLWYEDIYRKESGMSVHGGVFALRPHFAASEDRTTTVVDPETDLNTTQRRLEDMISVVASLVSHMCVLSKKVQSTRLREVLIKVNEI